MDWFNKSNISRWSYNSRRKLFIISYFVFGYESTQKLYLLALKHRQVIGWYSFCAIYHFCYFELFQSTVIQAHFVEFFTIFVVTSFGRLLWSCCSRFSRQRLKFANPILYRCNCNRPRPLHQSKIQLEFDIGRAWDLLNESMVSRHFEQFFPR